MEPAYILGTGGAIGAVLRYAVGLQLIHDRIPLATLAVNVIGTFVLTFITFAGISDSTMLFLGVGACGSFTTYSSFSVETVRMWEEGEPLRAAAYAVGTFILCLVGAGLAFGAVTLLGI